ncbi:hypothetical protein H9Q69_013400 [Fusarium xylarioides]|uniref:ABC transporter n=1 Tax=Fusarium xylarioides TaxID=221167 RepID=A0A9P7L106_9HYPO|nr:hypothetical protein H9Q72_011159 [Fusarium xylarioides]KAG5787530.1 hypothetical protein H9Q69_013400 [Fusarium xylarioides]
MTETSEKTTAATSSANPSRPPSSSRGGSTDTDATRPGTTSSIDSDNKKLDLTKADSKVLSPPKGENIEEHYRHLRPGEAEVLRRQVVSPEVKQGVAVLYRYASRNDIIIILISSICAIAGGAALPFITVVFGNLQGVFQDFLVNQSLSSGAFSDKLTEFVLYFVYLGIGEFVVVYISTCGFIYSGEHITAKIREHYLESCLRQNIGFFDKLGAGEVTTRITFDTNLIQDGISEKVSLTLAAVATFVSAFVIGFIKCWQLTLILFSTVVALLLNIGGGSTFIFKYTKQSLEAYAHGGNLADEVISSIRNAVAFGTQERLARQYDAHLKNAEHYGFRVKGAVAWVVAGMMLVLYLNYSLAFWQGSQLIVNGETSLSNILTIMMAVMIGTFSLGNVAPNVQAFTNAIAAAAKIFNIIDRVSPLDASSDKGNKLDHFQGTIRLSNIKHIYPSRPEATVIQNMCLDIPAGKVTALVGASGSGKSTIVGLLERFYDPVQGTVYLDGHDISKLNLRWLRQQMALVSQEPTLFGTTIFHNIRYGLKGTKHENASEEEQRELVIQAAKKANAHNFISALLDGYETHVGEQGSLLSGGQKQRIAIARAVVSNPKILLLDEATSALDTKSEGVVQAALENAAEGRTTITIAHRLSTIRDAHNIVVMAEGRIVEQGTHNELLEKKSAYYNLVLAQNIAAAEEVSAEEQAAIDEAEETLMPKMTSEKQDAIADPNDGNVAKLNCTTTSKSASSLALQSHKAEEEHNYGLWTLVKLIASFNRTEWKLIVIGLFFSAICGGGYPTQAVFFAKQVVTLSQPVNDENRHRVKRNSDFWTAMFLMLAIIQFLAFIIQGVLFAKCSERLVHRVRDRAFRTMLRQDVAFFDRDENTSGVLTSFLSTETTHSAGLSGVTLGMLLMVCTTLVSACVLSLAIGWKLSLVCISTIPVLLGCGFFRFYMLAHFQRRSKAAYDSSASFASEAISAIRTVAALTREEDVLKQYQNSLAVQQRRSLISVLKSSLLYTASQSLVFACFALGFWYGGTLIGRLEYTMFQFFLCFMAVIFGTQSAGTIFSLAPDMGKAHHAAGELKKLFDRQPVIDTWSDSGERLLEVDGTLEFRDVHFHYPTRPEQPVLRGLNLTVRPGQYIALVGASGCGKSTTIALLERFYDPISGGVFIDNHKISKLNINDYRSHIALVSQEPMLYQGTIKENILLGTAREDVPDDDIEHACREANIYDFIVSLPDGFNTVVGCKGALLSGGQKQRIAIARALIRDPKILLLDEATSALDSESEHVVQAALDKAAKGRTTIAVAHRLSTIQKADIIYIFDQGLIAEQGTHTELMKKNGRYAELVNLQSLRG